ncbi:hypothetical protein [Kitasatospora azatica]|uniref:hypothetical protein n=1 Tax=Kitasatospora azatica TaxID=58347 RepID=UPI0012F73CA2|nr:hypothetical protein [Kitasatospora azatica]
MAPTSLITALLYYFGWHHAYWFFDYFGVNSTVLGLSTVDYLIRSLDALFVPMTVTAALGLLTFWGHDLLRTRLAGALGPRILRVLLPALAGLGLLLTLGGLWSVFTSTFLSDHLALAPLSLALGVALLAYGVQLRRRSGSGAARARSGWAPVAEWAAVFALVGLSLFWAANDYAAAVGRARAQEFVAGLSGYPAVVLYSEHSLSLTAPGVMETRCHDADAAYRFRYDGLKLMLQSGDQYVLLPEHWRPADGVAIVLPRSGSVRLEFTPAARGTGAAAPSC